MVYKSSGRMKNVSRQASPTNDIFVHVRMDKSEITIA